MTTRNTYRHRVLYPTLHECSNPRLKAGHVLVLLLLAVISLFTREWRRDE